MDVRRNFAGVVKRANTNKPNQLAYAAKHNQVVTPNRDLAVRAAGDSLARTTGRWHFNIDDIPLQNTHPVSFNQSVNCESGSVLALAPTAMATMDNQWSRFHSVTDMATGAATIVYIFHS